jgi:hypothetical protein
VNASTLAVDSASIGRRRSPRRSATCAASGSPITFAPMPIASTEPISVASRRFAASHRGQNGCSVPMTVKKAA